MMNVIVWFGNNRLTFQKVNKKYRTLSDSEDLLFVDLPSVPFVQNFFQNFDFTCTKLREFVKGYFSKKMVKENVLCIVPCDTTSVEMKVIMESFESTFAKRIKIITINELMVDSVESRICISASQRAVTISYFINRVEIDRIYHNITTVTKEDIEASVKSIEKKYQLVGIPVYSYDLAPSMKTGREFTDGGLTSNIRNVITK